MTTVVHLLDTKKKQFNQGYTSTAHPFQSQESKIMEKHLDFVHPYLGIKMIIFDPKRPCLVYQLRALQLVN